MNPKVSIIMPVYNAEEFLAESVADILSQTCSDFELICVDDGSTDKSAAILERYYESDNRVRVIHQENRGGGAARNKGLEEATGKYLLFLDADDRFEKNMLEEAVNVAESENSEVVVFDADTFDYKTRESKAACWLITDTELNNDNPFKSFNNSVWNKLFLRELIIGNGIRFIERRAAYSTSFVVCAIMSAKRIDIVRLVLLHYRFNNPNSNVSNEDKDSTAIIEALAEVKEYIKIKGLYSEKRDVYLYLCEKELLQRLSVMKTLKGYRELYNGIRDKSKELFDLDGTEKNLSEMGFIRLDNICKYSLEEWLFNQIESIRLSRILEKPTFFLPIPIGDERIRIAIYGAGNVGKDFFIQSMRRKDIELVCWVDRNYESIGYPVQSPRVLFNNQYDYIVIAVSDKVTAKSIMCSLKEWGIPEDTLFYREPEFI